jgi:AcrR family transcriptional regulator
VCVKKVEARFYNQGMASKRNTDTAAKKKTPKRRSPISRQEGETRLIQAASTLLRSQPFSTVGVRDIATLADVNQGFIHTWFGSQHQLYLRVVQETFASMFEPLVQQPADNVALNPFDTDVQFAVRLLFWLDIEGVDTSSVKPQLSLLMDGFSQRLISTVGLDAKTVEAITLQGSAIGLGVSAFGHLIGADEPTKFAHALSVWRRQLELLAKNP